MPFRAAIMSVDACRSAAVADIEPGRDLLAAEARKAPRLHRDIREADRLPKAHRSPNARYRRPARTGQETGIARYGTRRGHDLQATHRQRNKAKPTNAPHRQ